MPVRDRATFTQKPCPEFASTGRRTGRVSRPGSRRPLRGKTGRALDPRMRGPAYGAPEGRGGGGPRRNRLRQEPPADWTPSSPGTLYGQRCHPRSYPGGTGQKPMPRASRPPRCLSLCISLPRRVGAAGDRRLPQPSSLSLPCWDTLHRLPPTVPRAPPAVPGAPPAVPRSRC